MPTLAPALAAALAAALVACTAGANATRESPTDAAVRQGTPTFAPLPPPDTAPREQTADQQVRHVLSRLTFGARPGDYERVRAMGVDARIARELSPAAIDDRATEQFVSLHFPTLSMSAADVLERYPTPAEILARRRLQHGSDTAVTLSVADSAEIRRAGLESRRVLTEIQSARVARALESERQLDEVMVDFWENHFTVFAGKGPSGTSCPPTTVT